MTIVSVKFYTQNYISYFKNNMEFWLFYGVAKPRRLVTRFFLLYGCSNSSVTNYSSLANGRVMCFHSNIAAKRGLNYLGTMTLGNANICMDHVWCSMGYTIAWLTCQDTICVCCCNMETLIGVLCFTKSIMYVTFTDSAAHRKFKSGTPSRNDHLTDSSVEHQCLLNTGD